MNRMPDEKIRNALKQMAECEAGDFIKRNRKLIDALAE